MDVELVRHALGVARARGFAEVELSDEQGSFSARMDPIPSSKNLASIGAERSVEPQIGEIRSSLVGYYRHAREPLAVGRHVTKGEVVAIVAALGISNEVESRVAGEVVEVLVIPNQPVEFGQPLAMVKLA